MTDISPPLPRPMSQVPQMAALGLVLEQVGDAKARMRLDYREDLVGYPADGILAGGVIYTLMDSVCGAAVFAALKKMQPIATLDLRMDYLKPATPHKSVFGDARCIKVTRHVCFVEGRAHHGDADDPIALVAGTFARKDRRAEAPS